MRRPPIFVLAALTLLLVETGCGKKGPPLAPLLRMPERIEDFEARRLGNDVHLTFTIPERNVDGTTPAAVDEVRIYAFTDDLDIVRKGALANRFLVETATLIATVSVEPPPPPPPDPDEKGPDAPPPATPADPRPSAGEVVTVVESITQAVFTLVGRPPVEAEEPEPEVVPPRIEAVIVEPVTHGLARFYTAVAVNDKGQLGAFSARLQVPLDEPPARPTSVTVTFDASAIAVAWEPAPGAPRPVQQAPREGVLSSRALGTNATLWRYNVYDAAAVRPAAGAPPAPAGSGLPLGAAQPVASAKPLNPLPLLEAPFLDTRLAFGQQRCYVVRSVNAAGIVRVESAPSDPVCVTPTDTFAPRAPQALAAIGSEGSVSLIWEPNTEADLAGYIVLRGVGPGDTLQPLMKTPLRETAYRDATARAGVRYIYAVVAVDRAGNRSPHSDRVEESAR